MSTQTLKNIADDVANSIDAQYTLTARSNMSYDEIKDVIGKEIAMVYLREKARKRRNKRLQKYMPPIDEFRESLIARTWDLSIYDRV
jgi:hypothetical protein